MAEQVRIGYKRLFEVRLLHHYWLDEGSTVFDLIPDQAKKDGRLLTYDVRPILSITPTTATEKKLKGLGCVYKTTALGCVVAASDQVLIPPDTIFEFVLKVQNATFSNYTALSLPQQKIYELYHQPEDKTYRYKENVAVYSNLTGASRGANPNKALYLSREIPPPTATDKVESLVLSGGGLQQLTGDQPGATVQVLNPVANNLPVFSNQADIPTVVPPLGLAGVPPRSLLLTDDIPDEIFALVRLTAVRADDGDYSFIDGTGQPKNPYPVYQIRFKNRSTRWKYFNKSTKAPTSTEANPLPLTFFGNAGTKQKPSEGFVKATLSAGKITELFSEIYE